MGHLLPLICLSHHPLHSRLLAIEFFDYPFLKLPESLQSIFFQLVAPLGFILLELFFDYLLGLLKLLRKEGVIPSHVLSVKGEALVETPWTNPVLFDLLVNDLEQIVFPLLGVHFLLMLFDAHGHGGVKLLGQHGPACFPRLLPGLTTTPLRVIEISFAELVGRGGSLLDQL